MNPPKEIWANVVSLSGLYSPEPLKLILDTDLGTYWTQDGNFSVMHLGPLRYSDSIGFASASYQEVKLWTEGAKAVMERLQKWCSLK